jgi:hypothetical protein
MYLIRMERNLLVEEGLTMLLTRFNLLTDPPYAERIRFRSLQESAVPSNNVIYAILCCAMKL